MPAELSPALARKLSKLTPKQIESLAHSCQRWVQFKEELRGTSTKLKLEWLKVYLDTNDVMVTCCSDEMREVQVIHYLAQMQRSGLIEKLPADFSFKDRRKWTNQVTIRNDWVKE